MEDPGIFEEVVRLRAAGRAAALATIVRASGSAPRHAGARLLVREDGTALGTVGGGALENEILRRAGDCLKTGRSELVKLDLGGKDKDGLGMLCGGEVEVFIERIGPPVPVLLFGGGHISRALVPILKLMGFHVTVIDDRPEMLTAERFPEADGLIACDISEAAKALDPAPATAIAILTRSHMGDREVLRWAVQTRAGYIGMIGSRAKVKAVFSSLETDGVPAERLATIHTPIGLDIGAETPAEIAVAIAAEMIAFYRGASHDDRPGR